ncbi:hypothetical protein ACI79P_19680 [Blastococcus sp. SYSU DS0510]
MGSSGAVFFGAGLRGEAFRVAVVRRVRVLPPVLRLLPALRRRPGMAIPPSILRHRRGRG